MSRSFDPRGLACAALAVLAAPLARAQEPSPATHAFASAVMTRMLAHPYLGRTVFDAVEAQAPYLFFVQRAPSAGVHRASEVAAEIGALLEPVRQRFERELVQPLALRLRSDTPALVVIVLGSHDAFEECYRATPGAWHFDARATFARDVGAAILYEDPAEPREPGERQRSASHALVHALQRAYYPGAEAAPIRSWLFEGMADALARPAEGETLPAPARLAAFVDDARAPATRWAHLRTLEEMCTVDEPLRLEEFFQQRTRDSSLSPGPDQDPWTAFYREATLLYAFLQGNEYRAGLAKWVGRAFAGQRGPDALAASFAPRKLDDLERAFLGWIQREHKRAFPDERIKPEVVLGALARDASGAVVAEAEPEKPKAGARGAGAAAPPRPSPVPVSPEPVSRQPAPRVTALPPLNLEDATPEERFALALAELGSGRIRAGRAHLSELATGAAPEFAARLAREDARAAAFEQARDAFLARVVSDKSLLGLDLGPKVSVKEFGVRAYTEGLVELDDKKGGIRRVPVETLDPLALARAMGSGPEEGDWRRFYVYVLRGDERWKKLLRPDDGEGSLLLADARADYPARLLLGNAVQRIQSLAGRPAPTTPKDVQQRIELFRGLLEDAAETSVVVRKRAALRAHAQALFELAFDFQGPAAILKGELEPVKGERVRITYDFDDPHELDDFSVEHYVLLASRSLREKSNDVPFTVEHGELTAMGEASLRTLYDLDAPLTVRYDVMFEDVKVEEPAFYFTLGICDDRAGHFIRSVNLNSLQLVDGPRSIASPEVESTFTLGRANALELRHDGETVRLFCDGKPTAELAAGKRQSGALFLHTKTDLPLHVQKLVIEGNLQPDSFERMRRVWAAKQMAGL